MEAIESYRDLDSSLAVIGSAIRSDQDLVLVTSDHDQETIDPTKRIDLRTVARGHGLALTVVDEGTAAMLAGPGAISRPGSKASKESRAGSRWPQESRLSSPSPRGGSPILTCPTSVALTAGPGPGRRWQ